MSSLHLSASLASNVAKFVANIAKFTNIVDVNTAEAANKNETLPMIKTEKGNITSLGLVLQYLVEQSNDQSIKQSLAQTADVQTEMDKWIDVISSVSNEGVTDNVLDYINETALHSTYLINLPSSSQSNGQSTNQCLSLADYAMFAAIHDTIARDPLAQLNKRPSLMRWFSLVQAHQSQFAAISYHLPADAYKLFQVSLATPAAPSSGTSAAQAKTAVAGLASSASAALSNAANAISNAVASVTKKDDKSEKTEKKAEKASKPAKAAPAEVPQIYRLDLRVCSIASVASHPTEARLLVLTLNCGEAQPRTVVSGIAELVPEADRASLVGKRVLNMCNLAPSNIKGVDSNGRILVATDATNEKLKEILFVEANDAVKDGDKIVFSGIDVSKNPTDGVIAPKNLHKVLKGLKTDENGNAMFESLPIITAAGPVKCSIKQGTVA